MKKNLFLIFIFFFFIQPVSVFGQKLSNDQAVVNAFFYSNDKTIINEDLIKRYDPFDDFTFFTPILGARVYDKKILIDMFPIAISAGNVNSYKPNTSLRLLFIASSKDSDKSIHLGGFEIIFLIDGKKYDKKIGKNDFVTFNNPDIYLKLYKAKNVRARIEKGRKFYEIDMSKKVRSTIGVLLKNISFE